MKEITASMAGTVLQVLVSEGEEISVGQVVVMLESMKMEIPLTAPISGIVREVRVKPGAPVKAGQRVLVVQSEDVV